MQEAASQKTTIVYEAPTPEASAVAGPEPARRSKVKMSITEDQIGNSVEAALASCFSPELKNQINRDVLTIQIRSALTDLLQNSQVQVIKNKPEITPKPDNPTTVPVSDSLVLDRIVLNSLVLDILCVGQSQFGQRQRR